MDIVYDSQNDMDISPSVLIGQLLQKRDVQLRRLSSGASNNTAAVKVKQSRGADKVRTSPVLTG